MRHAHRSSEGGGRHTKKQQPRSLDLRGGPAISPASTTPLSKLPLHHLSLTSYRHISSTDGAPTLSQLEPKGSLAALNTAIALKKARTLVYITTNLNRTVTDQGAIGSTPGDTIQVNGLVYGPGGPTTPLLGNFDLTATITAVTGSTKRELKWVELELNDPAFPGAKGPGELSFAGVEVFPATFGGRIDPFTLAVVGGTGAFVGASGEVLITYDPSSFQYTYTVTLLS